MTNTCYTYLQLQEAVQACTPCSLTISHDEDWNRFFNLLDGCGDRMGDPFDDLYDVQSYVTENQDVFNYLARFNK